jgi:phospholipid transport system substrate-binding protein
MLRRVLFALLIASLGVSTFAAPGYAETAAKTAPAKPGPGTAVVKQANETLASLLKQNAAPTKVAASVRSFLDIDELGKAALADHWKDLKPAEQQEFLRVLRELIEANYVKAQTSNLAYTVDYLGESADKDGNVVVQTRVNAKRKGRPMAISVDYVLLKQGSQLRAFDVKTDGVGLVENYRAQFNKLIRDKGFAAVLETMKKKLASIQAQPTAPKG